MVSFEVVFQVLNLVFSKCEQFLLLAHRSFQQAFLVLNKVFFSKCEQVMLLTHGKLFTGVSSSKG